MTAYFASNENPFDNFVKPERPIQATAKLNNPSSYAHNDEHLSVQKNTRQKEAIRCGIGLVLYAIGLFLFAYGQMVQPSLLLMLAGSAVLILGCHTFMPEAEVKANAALHIQDEDETLNR